MPSSIIRKARRTFAFSLKVVLLTSILLSQTFLAEIFSYSQRPGSSPVRIASAAADPYPLWGGKDVYTVSNHPGAGYQALFPVTWKAGMKSDFSDLRFSDGSGNVIPYWIESKTDGVSVQAWVKLTASNALNVHYGNAGAASESNGHAVFAIFSDGTELGDFTIAKQGSASAVAETATFDSKSCIHVAGEPNVISSSNLISTATLTKDFVVKIRNRVDNERYWDTSFGAGTVQDMDDGGNANWWHTTLGNGYLFAMQSPVSGEGPRDAFISVMPQGGGGTIIEELDGVFTTLNAWHDIGISYDGTGQLKYYHDGSEVLSAINVTFLNDEKHLMLSQGEYSGGQGGNRYIDYVFVRQYAATAPTFSAPTTTLYSAWTGTDTYNVSNNPGAGYQALFPVVWKTGMNSDFSDLRFSDGAGNIIPYWIESKTDGVSAQVWIKLTASTTVNLHYGNAAAGSESNLDNVMIAGEDFENGVSKWQNVNGDSTLAADTDIRYAGSASGKLTRSATGSGYHGKSLAIGQPLTSCVVESRVRAEASHNPTFPIPSQESNFGNSANSYFYNNFIGVWDTVETRLVDPYVPNRWYQEKVVVKDMTHIDYYIDGNLLLANRPPAGSTTSLSYIYIGVDQGASAAGYYDNIFVRRYAATVPTFVLDEAVPPTVNAGADHTQSAVFTQTATASDAGSGINPSSYQWAKVSGPGTVTFGSANALSTTISVDQDGTYVIAFTAQDLAGNSAASTFTLVWDTTLPVVTGVSEGGTYDTDKTITFNEGTAALDSAAFASGGTVSTEGSHTLVVTSAGGTVTIHFTIDKTDPDSFTPDSPSGTITDRTPAFSWHVWPHATKYQLYLDGALEADNLSAPSYTTPVELACGNHTWQARAFRAEENPINTGLVSFTINCGGGFMPPAKPSIAETKVTDAGGRLDIFNLPANIVQFAASATIDFKQASWQALDRLQTTLARFADTAKFYLKFRSREGGVSDVLTYENKDLGSVKISEGDIVKTADNPDVYIIKYKNGKQYKRLILSPSVFRSYGHLKWENIKTIPRAQMDSFATSSLVQVGGDKKVYELFPEGDTGRRKVFAVYKDGILKQVQDDTSGWDADSVYEINAVDRDSYILEK